MITIVKMDTIHCSAVAKIEADCFSAPWSERSILSELANPLSLWLVALIDGVVVGYVGSQSVMGEADMMNLAVDEKYRRLGVGRQLVEALVLALKEHDVYSLTLEVRASNDSAICLYQGCGFVQVGRRPGYYQKPKEDALILRKEWAI